MNPNAPSTPPRWSGSTERIEGCPMGTGFDSSVILEGTGGDSGNWRGPGFNGSSDSQGLTSLDLYGFEDGVP